MKTLLLILNIFFLTSVFNAQTVTWTGATSTNWGTSTNWSTNVVPDVNDSIIIPPTINSPIIDDNRTIRNILIQFSAALDFGGKIVTVKEDFTNDGTVSADNSTIIFSGVINQKIDGDHTFHNVEINNSNGVDNNFGTISITGSLSLQLGTFETNNSLILVSDSSGDASIGEIAIGADISGDVEVQRYISATSTSWHFLSFPVKYASLNDWNDDIITTGMTGSDYPNWPSAVNPWASISKYDESILGDLDSGFNSPTTLMDTAVDGQGFMVWSGNPITPNADFTIDVKGEVCKGDIDLDVSYTDSGNSDDDGWNLVGNPYPSTIDWDAADWVKTNIDNAIYIYDPEKLQYASYVSGVPNNGGSKYISSSQGFWVKASGAAPLLRIKEGVKSSVDTTFFRTSLIPFSISVTKGQFTDQASLCINPMATLDYDANYDAFKIYSKSVDVPSIVVVSEDDQDLSINSFMAEESMQIPIKVTAHNSGIAELAFNGFDGLNSFNCVFLEDKLNGHFIDVKIVSSYTFHLNSMTDSARFVLHISNVLADFDGEETVVLAENNGEYSPVSNAINASLYYWDFGDDNSSVLSNPVHYFTQQGIYNVELTVSNSIGCVDTKSMTVEVVENTVSVDEHSYSNIKIYPNPIKIGMALTIDAPEGDEFSIQVYDVVGKVVLEEELESNQKKIRMNNRFQTGIYYLKILNHVSAETWITKLMITD